MLTLEQARTDLPALSAFVPAAPAGPAPAAVVGPPMPVGPEPPIPTYFQDFLNLAKMVDAQLPGPTMSGTGRDLAHQITDEFMQVADLARGE